MSKRKFSPTAAYWNAEAADILVGRKITAVRYMTSKEAANAMWAHRALMFHLDDGTVFCAMRDDEGNDAGALAILLGENADDQPVLPVLLTGSP